MSGNAWPRTLGIVGGLGPYAHIEFERRILELFDDVESEQEYPPFLVASFPSTPDRTAALLHGGASPVPLIVHSLEALAGAADFAVIACITAHGFLDQVRPKSPLPILDMVEATLDEVVDDYGESAHVGVLATTGTLRAGLFQTAARRVAPGLRVTSLLDLDSGERLHEQFVMTPIYGPLADGRRTGGGLKIRPADESLAELLYQAVARLTREGTDVVLTGCTEIGMALASGRVDGTKLLDPLDVAVQRALEISCGKSDLPVLSPKGGIG